MTYKPFKSDETLVNILRFWMAYPLWSLSGWIGGSLFKRLVIESTKEASQ